MFVINDDNSIYATRGDIVFFYVTADNNGENHKFQPGDVLRMKVYGKKDAENVVMQKDFPVEHVTERVEIYLSKEDTKFGEVISKPRDYWYEIELNPFDMAQTIVGYGEDGPCVFRLMPEGDDVEEIPVTPEDIPIVDDELDMTSTRPVQNQAIARAFQNLLAGYEATNAAVAKIHVTPQMYGAIGDGMADDTKAIQEAFDAVGENGCVLIPEGTYLVKSLNYNTSYSKLMMYGKFVQMAGHEGDLLTVTGRHIELHNLHMERECTTEGVASEDLRNVGLKITESKNINVHCPIIKNFRVGILAHSDKNGCAYIDIYSPQIIAYEGIKSAGSSWVNEIHTFGGRISIHETYTDYSGSSYLNLMGDCNRIFGMCVEGTKIERKIKGGFSNSLFIGCRFEGVCVSGTDIEVTGSWNAFIHNRDVNENIVNTGEGNNFLDNAMYRINSAIVKNVVKMVSSASETSFTGNWQKPLILADATAASMTIGYPQATSQYVKGVEFTVKKVDDSEHTVYVYVRNSLDGQQVTLKKKNEAITFFSDGEAWHIKSHYIPA